MTNYHLFLIPNLLGLIGLMSPSSGLLKNSESLLNSITFDVSPNPGTIELDTSLVSFTSQGADIFEVGILDVNPLPKAFSGEVARAQKDYYKFSLMSSSEFRLNLSGLNGNASVILADSQGNVIAISRNGGLNNESIRENLEAGEYVVLVSPPVNSNTPTNYFLQMAARFIVDDDIVSNPLVSLPDPEFDQVGFRVGWQELDGSQLWVASIDPANGDLLLNTAQAIDTNLAPIGSVRNGTGTGNGPEWVTGSGGTQLVYTKVEDPNQLKSSFLGITQGVGVNLQPGSLPIDDTNPLPQGNTGMSPIGSLDLQDPQPRVVYALPDFDSRTFAWRNIGDIAGDVLPGDATTIGRWVDGKSDSLVYTAIRGRDSISQVVQYDIENKSLTQLTDSTTKKDDVYMWRAPEFNNELIFFALETDRSIASRPAYIGVYRASVNGWQLIKRISPPSRKKFLRSPESFVYNGKSYISMLVEDRRGGPSEIWIAGIEPDFDFYREVSDPRVTMVRNDPEFFVTQSGPVIYYAEKSDGVRIVHRAATGL
jgi:hypothetical protein